jgi:hypothetical protein
MDLVSVFCRQISSFPSNICGRSKTQILRGYVNICYYIILFFSLWHSLFLFSFFIVLGGGTLNHLQRFLQCIKYITLEIPPSTALFHPFSLNFCKFQQITFLYLHMWCYIILTAYFCSTMMNSCKKL